MVPAAAGGGEVVRTEGGLVRGMVQEDVRTFRGIPYAAPPERWRSPRPARPWEGIRDATEHADSCAQPEHPVGMASTNEDCLYLDVTTPRSDGKKRPVVVWIHGGSFTNGANSVYGPDRFAGRGEVVVVQVQYRLGAFGFLASPLLGEDSGNYGLEDQQAALRWVRRNAQAFGGDPRNVTVMGESAGAYSVCDHLASPTAAGLFDRAIIQSGPCAQEYSAINYAAPRPRSVANHYSSNLATELGCTTAACMRAIPAEELLAATADDEFGPVLGGRVLPHHPAKKMVNNVPVLHAVNHDEESGRYGAQEVFAQPITQAEYETAVRETFGAKADKILAEYADVRPAGRALATVMTDSHWSTPAARTNRILSTRMPTYAVEFAGEAPWYAGAPKPTWPVGSHHLSDVAYFFDLAVLEPPQQEYADQLITTWADFARTGTTPWPRTRPGDRTVQSLTPTGTTRTDFVADHRIRFWQ
ncbi:MULTISPECIES: carboxylesterase family protein [unclassified Kribbella]|uniref:carboxylesterase/lipase family protein n=1 Tax=unclassified Kribbella TaxID=2644121 RepID=UPI0033F6B4E2